MALTQTATKYICKLISHFWREFVTRLVKVGTISEVHTHFLPPPAVIYKDITLLCIWFHF